MGREIVRGTVRGDMSRKKSSTLGDTCPQIFETLFNGVYRRLCPVPVLRKYELWGQVLKIHII